MISCDYVFYGGNHYQELSNYNLPPQYSCSIIDPGALCCLSNNLAGFAIISFDGVIENISFKAVEYDINLLFEDLYKLNVPARDSILSYNYKIKQKEEVFDKDDRLKKYILNSGNVFIGWKKHLDGYPVINREFLRRLISISLKKAKYINFGCWDSEKYVINEITNTLEIIKKEHSDFNAQVWYTVTLTEKSATLVTENLINESGKVKWFELTLLDSLSSCPNEFVFSMAHYANEIYLNDVTIEELSEIREIINSNEAYYRVSPSKS